MAWKNEAEAREQIKAMVAEYYHDFKEKKTPYQEGDRITYAARVFDEKEMCALTDATLDFWLTTGRFADQFEKEFAEHAAIADHFSYKISVHSGSDKFSVFRIVGKYTHGRFHVKTAGTSWLEAMVIIAEHCPALYREVHQFALETGFQAARKYYHVTTDLTKIPALDTLTDAQLPQLFEQDDARQLIHITYGVILSCKNEDGSFRFRDRLYEVWRTYAAEYAARLEKHIGRHLQMLYEGFEA